MEIRSKLMIKSLLGLVIGMIIGVVTWMLSNPALGNLTNTALILHLVVSGLLGMICMGSSIVYDFDSWGLLKATIVHYVACMVSFTTASILLSWFPTWTSFAAMGVMMTLVYAGIWIGESIHWKKTINSLNEQLRNIQK